MNVKQIVSEGLKREYEVTVPLQDLDTKVLTRLADLKDKVRINGFRPGKVPLAHLKRLYGKSVMAEVVQQAIDEANSKISNDNGYRLAGQPKVKLPEDEASVNALLDGKSDLSYSVAMEILPKIEIKDYSDIEIEKQASDISDSDVDEAIGKIADNQKNYQDKSGEAASNDRLTISFVGKIDGEAFEGGTAKEIPLVLGSGSFIPGFEDQLIGAKAGEDRTVNVTFPEAYAAKNLAGKAAVFDVTVDKVESPIPAQIDDELAKKLGVDSLDKLKEAVRDNIQREYDAVVRRKLKRQLLDALDERHKFEVPPTLVEEEFQSIWKQVLSELQQGGKTFADEDTSEDTARDDYMKIAERRVRLGLLLAEIGEKQKIQITDDEVTRAVVERARQFPGQEQQVWDFYRKNAQALASLRAPIFEEKVVDYLLDAVKIAEKKVSKDDLLKEEEEKLSD